MKKIRVIVMDMDGTLLTSEKIVTEHTKEVLRKAKEKGYRIGIASGRPLIGIQRSIESLGIDDIIQFMVASNGAQMYDIEKEKEYGFYQLEPDVISEIIDLYSPFDLNAYVYQGATCYAYRNDSIIRRAAKNNHLDIHLCNLKKEITKPQSKLVLSTPPEKMKKVEKFYESHKSDRYRAFKSQADMFEFVNPKLSKVYGIEEYCREYGYTLDEVIAFGDTTNDLEMIRECGVGVCMCNGTDDVKVAADIITERSNDEDGLAYVIERELL